jgi:hypothetical protein
MVEAGGVGIVCAPLKTCNLLIFQDDKNEEHGSIVHNSNIPGTGIPESREGLVFELLVTRVLYLPCYSELRSSITWQEEFQP